MFDMAVEDREKTSAEKGASLPNAAEGYKEDRVLVLGSQLLEEMDWASYEALRTTARILVDKRLGHFRNTINPHTYSVMIEYKMKQIAVARYYRADKQTVG